MRRATWIVGLVCGIHCCVPLARVTAQEQPRGDAPESKPRQGAFDLSGLLELGSAKAGELAQSAADLRKATESAQQAMALLERIMPTVGPLILGTSENLSRISSEFDPFGYKTAFRALQTQSEIIERQQQLIQKLQQAEIDRLQRELQAVKKKGKQPRKRSPASKLVE